MTSVVDAMAKAQSFARKIKAKGLNQQGWSGFFWDSEDTPAGQVVLEANRSGDDSKTVDETILLCWEGSNFVKGVYRAYGREKTVKNAAEALRLMAQAPARVPSKAASAKGRQPRMTGKSRAGRNAPDFSTMTDMEVIDALAGKTVTFERVLDGVEETVTLPPKTREEDGKEKKNDISVTRNINFIGGPVHSKAFRAIRISQIITIS